mmetsp:Transcript_5664/g.20297  ORF Transcript_5664/g.20297 Transcript_5664/m.20297 type:complete len:810 (-) Transcript_5664:1174-3603(-)
MVQRLLLDHAARDVHAHLAVDQRGVAELAAQGVGSGLGGRSGRRGVLRDEGLLVERGVVEDVLGAEGRLDERTRRKVAVSGLVARLGRLVNHPHARVLRVEEERGVHVRAGSRNARDLRVPRQPVALPERRHASLPRHVRHVTLESLDGLLRHHRHVIREVDESRRIRHAEGAAELALADVVLGREVARSNAAVEGRVPEEVAGADRVQLVAPAQVEDVAINVAEDTVLQLAVQHLAAPVVEGAQPNKDVRREAVVVQHDHPREEPAHGLERADLQVSEGNELLRHQAVHGRVAGRALHDVILGVLPRHRDGGHHVRAEVNAQDEHRGQRKRRGERDEDEERRDLGDVRRQGVRNRLLQVVEDEATLLDASHDGREVVVEQNHVGSGLGHLRARDAHSDTDIGLLERRGVVHAVSRHRHNLLLEQLELLHDLQLLRRRRAREHDLVMGKDVLPLLVRRVGRDRPTGNDDGRGQVRVLPPLVALAEVVDLVVGGNLVLRARIRADDVDHLCDGLGRLRVVTSDHHDTDAGGLAVVHGTGHGGARRVDEGGQADHDERLVLETRLLALLDGFAHREVDVALRVESVAHREALLVQAAHREAQHAAALLHERRHLAIELSLALVRELDHLAIDDDLRAARDDAVRRTLHVHRVRVVDVRLVVGLDHHEVVLVARVERDLGHLGELLAGLEHQILVARKRRVLVCVRRAETHVLRELDDGGLRRISLRVPLHHGHPVAKGRHLTEQLEGRHRVDAELRSRVQLHRLQELLERRVVALHRGRELVLDKGRLERLVVVHQVGERHHVHGERARLV